MIQSRSYVLGVVVVTLALVTLACSIGGSTAPSPEPEPLPTNTPVAQEAELEKEEEGSQVGSEPKTDDVGDPAPDPGESGPPTPIPDRDLAQCSLGLDKDKFYPNEPMTVYFTTPGTFEKNAWVGIIPSDAPHGQEAENDAHDLSYQHLDGHAQGELEFVSPIQPGRYDFRMHNTDKEDGKEVATISFVVVEMGEVKKDKPSLALDKTIYQPGEEIRVRFTTPAKFESNAWVGIIPSDTPHGDEDVNDAHDLDFQYLKGETLGVLIFTAPDQPGGYDFRMHDTDDQGKEVSSVSFTVLAAPEADEQKNEREAADVESIFPLPDDVSQFFDMGDGEKVSFQTGMSQDEVIAFYRQALTDIGLVERPILSVIEEEGFSMVFDGWEDGRSVVIQGVDFGDTFNVSIRLEGI